MKISRNYKKRQSAINLQLIVIYYSYTRDIMKLSVWFLREISRFIFIKISPRLSFKSLRDLLIKPHFSSRNDLECFLFSFLARKFPEIINSDNSIHHKTAYYADSNAQMCHWEYWTSRETTCVVYMLKIEKAHHRKTFVIYIKFKFYLFMLTYEMLVETMNGKREIT